MAPASRKKIPYTGPLLAIVALAGVGALLFAILKPQPVTAELGRVSRGPMELIVQEDGRTRVEERYTVSTPLAGNLARPELKAGDTVSAGQVLARLLPLSPALLDQRSRLGAEAHVAAAAANEQRLKADIARAETTLAFAEQQAERHESLREGHFASEAEIDRARTEARAARQELRAATFAQRVAAYELRMAKAALGSLSATGKNRAHLEITAPSDGVVLKVLQESEGVVQPGTPLFELGDTSRLEAVVAVLSTDAVHVALGAPARIVRWGGDKPLKSRVRSKEPSAFTTQSALGVEEQRVNVVLELTSPTQERVGLGDGYRVEAEIRIWHTDNALRVPASAVFRGEKNWSVFAVGKDAVVERRSIRTGHHGPNWIEVLGGVPEGQAVVLYPTDRIVDGTIVQTR